MGNSDKRKAGFGLLRALIGILPLVGVLISWSLALLVVYITVGFMLMVVQFNVSKPSRDKMVPDALMYVFLWPEILMLWPELKPFKRKTLLDEFNSVVDNNPALKFQRDYFQAMSKNGTTEDEIPNGVGKFGYVPTNPIPVNNIFASYAYLRRLREQNGKPVEFERTGSVSTDAIENPIDEYLIKNREGKLIATLYISPYQKTISRKAPEGFKLV